MEATIVISREREIKSEVEICNGRYFYKDDGGNEREAFNFGLPKLYDAEYMRNYKSQYAIVTNCKGENRLTSVYRVGSRFFVLDENNEADEVAQLWGGEFVSKKRIHCTLR